MLEIDGAREGMALVDYATLLHEDYPVEVIE